MVAENYILTIFHNKINTTLMSTREFYQKFKTNLTNIYIYRYILLCTAVLIYLYFTMCMHGSCLIMSRFCHHLIYVTHSRECADSDNTIFVFLLLKRYTSTM